MTTRLRISAALSIGAMAAALAVPAFGQADNTNSLTAPDWVRDRAQSSPYSGPYYNPDAYYSSRQAYMEEAGRRWDAEAEIHRGYRSPYAPYVPYTPYATKRNVPRHAQDRRGAYIGGTGIDVGHDTNPNDYEVGIYNPKQ